MILPDSEVEKYVQAFRPAVVSAMTHPEASPAQLDDVLGALIRDVAKSQYDAGRKESLGRAMAAGV